VVKVVVRVNKMSLLGVGRPLGVAGESVARNAAETQETEDERSVTMGKRVGREDSGCLRKFLVNSAFG
jgi:hypothetical protein